MGNSLGECMPVSYGSEKKTPEEERLIEKRPIAYTDLTSEISEYFGLTCVSKIDDMISILSAIGSSLSEEYEMEGDGDLHIIADKIQCAYNAKNLKYIASYFLLPRLRTLREKSEVDNKTVSECMAIISLCKLKKFEKKETEHHVGTTF